MKGLKTTKRLIAAVLSLVMVLGMLPVIPLSINAAGTSGDVNYVSLPITIRDFAADGMLFECNELGDTGTMSIGGPTAVFQEASNMDKGSKQYINGYVRYTGNNNAGMYLTFYLTSGSYTRNDVRYAVIRYSTNSAPSSNNTPQISQRKNSTYYNYVNLSTSTFNNGWQIALLDLGGGTDQVNYVTLYPRLPSGKYIDIDYIAFYDNLANAQWAQKNNNVTPSGLYHHGNNLGFGMLTTSAASHINNLFEDMATDGLIVNKDGIPGTTYYRNGKWGSVYKEPCNITLNSGIQQTLYGGVIRTDLVSAELVDKRPVYTEAAVTYLANYMSQVMQVPWQNSDGSYNMWYVVGQKLEELGNQDLASHLRAQIKANNNAMGTYAEAKAAYGTEALDSYEDIDTYFKAAYFLLHGTFDDNVGYGQAISAYKELRLVEKTGADGKTYYVFNSGYNASKYDPVSGVIINTQTDVSDYHQGNAANKDALRGNAWYVNRFDPLNPSLFNGLTYEGYPIAGDTYRDIAGMTNSDQEEAGYYENTNYHLSLEGHAQFIYHHEDELYFTFTGDDDVYLYINGVRVLDLGGAHSISKVRIDLNDPTIVEKCQLEEGEAYDFDFFYMERHGSAANFSIETNIKIVNPSMVTTKKAYQDGQAIGYNGFVKDRNENDLIVYEFGLENKGEAHLNNLTFVDSDIDVTVGYDQISLNSFTTISDITATIYHTDGSTTVYESLDEATLKAVLTQGIAINEKIVLYGFNYNVPDADWVNNSFVNRLETFALARYENSSTEKLTGVADWMVQKYDYIFDSFHMYDGGKLAEDGLLVPDSVVGATASKEQLLSMLKTATDGQGRPLVDTTYPNVSVNVNDISGSVLFTAAGYGQSEKVLQLMNPGVSFNIGTFDLSKYTAVEFTYGSDSGAMLGTYRSELILTDKDGNELGRKVLSNPQAGWKAGSRTVDIPVNSNYNGPVYVSMNMQPRPNGSKDGVAINKIQLVGKTSNAIELSEDAVIKLSSPSGATVGAAVNKNAVLNDDQSITYRSVKPGEDTFYYIIQDGNEIYGPITVTVYTYAVADSIFVLDYNLPVELNNGEHSFFNNDVLDLGAINPFGTAYTFQGHANGTSNYGYFAVDGESVKYVMDKFMNGLDTIEVQVQVLENGATELNSLTGVALTQTVSVVPANVMYYEDDFTGEGAITYVNTGSDAEGNIWAVYEGAYKGDQQSADQDMNYGSDPNYAENGTDIRGKLELSYLENAPEGVTLEAVGDEICQTILGSADEAGHTLFGDASNDTIHAMAINSAEAATLMSFTFTGTGFEIVGRTTTSAYAVLTIMITNVETGAMAAFPVITECVNGDLCQIPFAARKDLAYGTYEVTVIGSNASNRDRMVYVDGVRVYHPLTKDQAATYYKADEVASQIIEIKDQIAAGNVVYGEIGVLQDKQDNEGNTTLDFNWGFGNTMIENFLPDNGFGDYTLVGCESLEEYLEYGPNNEIYLSNAGGAVLSYIAFYVVLDENYEGERSIQIGAHLKSTRDGYRVDKVVIGVDEETEESIYEEVFVPQSASLRVGNCAADFESQDTAVIITTGTEQYYDVDIAWKPVNDNGVDKTLVVIGIDNAETNDVLSLTNIKLNGYKIATQTAAEMTVVQDASDINASILMSRVVAIGEALVNKD